MLIRLCLFFVYFFFFKQKTAYEMRISDWSSDVCSSDLDSIPAIFAVTDEPFLVFTANAFAILGLRAMYFLLADLIHRFVYLKLGLALVLIWVGIKMLLKIDVFYIPTPISLAVVNLILGVSVIASLIATRGQARRVGPAPENPPFRIAHPADRN